MLKSPLMSTLFDVEFIPSVIFTLPNFIAPGFSIASLQVAFASLTSEALYAIGFRNNLALSIP